ncbi:MAG: aspartate aminotransferase family protein [Candidatus Hydrogenedentota bacterium]|nr:MAG: aspartate aminotransferase family protein [Candidatus Hydrogenedentota bacterium]
MKLQDFFNDNLDRKAFREEVLECYRKYVNPAAVDTLAMASLDIVEWEREGAYIKDLSGEEFIDCVEGAGCFNVGRHNREIAEVIKKAVDRYDMGGWIGVIAQRAALAEKLAEISPEGLQYSFFTSGGGEAIDTAIKFAKGATGKPKIISTINGYHGHTGYALSATGRDIYKEPFHPLMPGFTHVPYNNLEALEETIDRQTAGVIMETIQGEGGIIVPDEDYLPGVREICDTHGVIMILDEVQTGFGRTGRMFGCEHWNVSPDIMVMSKSMTAGFLPISANIFNEKVAAFTEANPFIHGNSHGGTAITCLASLAGIEYIERNDLCGNAERMGAKLMEGLRELQEKYPDFIKDVRGKGLMIGIEFPNEDIGPLMSAEIRKNGVVTIFTFNNPKVVRIMPTLVITEKEVHKILVAYDKAIEVVSKLV